MAAVFWITKILLGEKGQLISIFGAIVGLFLMLIYVHLLEGYRKISAKTVPPDIRA